MNSSLNLIDHLLERGRRFQQLGRPAEALQALSRLASFQELPAEVSEETQVRLGLLHLKRRRFGRARRHLAAALRHRPDSARYHFLMATACRADGEGDPERASHHYERSLELDPAQARCLAEHGLLCLRLGRTEQGLERLRQAGDLAPDQAEIVARVVKGLCQCGQPDEARAILRAALFRNPRSLRFRQLWVDFQWVQARRNQEVKALAKQVDEGPVLLPFVRSEKNPQKTPTAEDRQDRADDAEPLPGPHRPRLLRRVEIRRIR
jgi:Tfp pilus assembly protein PilF